MILETPANPTLDLVDVEAAQRNAIEIVRRLRDHPAVEQVFFPGLPEADLLGVVGRQMEGPGEVLAFEVSGGREAAAKVLEAVNLMNPAVSLGSTDTLIQHPASLTHHVVDVQTRECCGISHGPKDVDDLWADLSRALSSAIAESAGASAHLLRIESFSS